MLTADSTEVEVAIDRAPGYPAERVVSRPWPRQLVPSWADAGYLAFYPLLLAGLLTLPGPRRSVLDRVKLGLDAAIVLIGGGMAVWYLVIEPTVQGHEPHVLDKVLSVAYPVGD